MTSPDRYKIYGDIAKESCGFVVAETVSMSTSLLVVGVADTLAPSLIKDVSKFVGKHVIEPFLDPIENTLGTVCRIKECQPDKTKPRAERAENIAKTMIVFSAAWAASMAAKVATRRIFNRALGIADEAVPAGGILSANEKRILVYDEGVHYGSILMMNTLGAGVTDEMLVGTTKVLTKAGIPEKKAKELSSMAIIWELPNLLGMVAGIGAIFRNHLHGSSARG